MPKTATRPGTAGRAGAVLAAVCLAGLLLPISLTGASVALPSIGTDLHSGLAGVQWVVNGYDLTFASVMLAAGSLADLFGRKRMFGGGLALFTLCSLLAGLAPNAVVLDIVRAVAGIGAAGVLTSGSAVLAQTFDGPARARAFAALGTAFGVGIAFGPVLSGLEVSSIGWRGMFVSHSLVGIGVLALLFRHIQESRSPEGGRVDWAGTVTFTTSLFLFIFALIQGPQWGWGSPVVIGSLVGFVAGLAAFAMVESRQQRPMFDVTLFFKPRFVAISLVPVVLAFGFTAVLMFLPSYFMSVDADSAGKAGLLLMFLTVPTLVLPMVGGTIIQRLSHRLVLSASLFVTAAGAAWLTVVHPGSSVLVMAGPLVTIGVGFGIPLGILDGAAIGSVEPGRAGMAAGMFNTMRLAGEVVAIAAMGSLLVSFTHDSLTGKISRFSGSYRGTASGLANDLVQGHLSGSTGTVPAGPLRTAFTAFAADGYTSALHTALWLLTAICAVGAAGIALLLKNRDSAAERPAPAADGELVPAEAEFVQAAG